MMKTTIRFAFLACVVVTSALSSCAPDPAQSCNSLCTGAGFGSGRLDAQENESNCFCEGGDTASTVAEADCTAMCESIGLPTSQVFGDAENPANACQCAP